MLKKFIIIGCVYIIGGILALSLHNTTPLYAADEVANVEVANLELSNNQPSGLRLTSGIGYAYHNLNGAYGKETNYNPYAMVDITYLIRNTFEIGFGFGIDKLLLAKKGVNVSPDFKSMDSSFETMIPSFFVIKYNVNLNSNQDLIFAIKIGNAFGISSNYIYINEANNIYKEEYFQSVGFFGSSIGYAINNWVIAFDYSAYEIINAQKNYVPLLQNPSLLYGINSYDKNYSHKFGLSINYRLTSFMDK